MKQGISQAELELGVFDHNTTENLDENDDHGLSYILQARRASQVGDIETLRFLLDNKLVSAGATDSDECSLLHWASINNRIEVDCLQNVYSSFSASKIVD